MSTRCLKCVTYLSLVLLYSSFVLQCILTEECHPDEAACETYLAIYLETAKHNAFPASLFEADFITFATAFNAMCNEVCEYEYMAYPTLYYIHIDSTSDTEPQYTFAIHLFCDANNAQSMSCCNDFYDNYLNRPSYGILVETWVKHMNKDTLWQDIDIEGRTVDYFWDYKLQNSSFQAPTVSPTLSPLQYTIECQYTSQYLSIICDLNPSYKTSKNSNTTNVLTMYERSSALCTKLFDTTSQSLDLFGFQCDECKSAQCQLKDVSYDEEVNEIEIWSIQIFLTIHCTVSVGASITLCISFDHAICQHISSGIVKESSNDDDLYPSTDASMIVSSPYYVSSQCMVYTVYDDIQSHIGVTDIESTHWSTNDNHTHSNPCFNNNCCTFYRTGNTMTEQSMMTLSVETAWGSQHNTSSIIQYQDNIAFIPLIYHAPYYVSFKPIYVSMDIIISCDRDVIHVNIYDWIASIDADVSIFSFKWTMQRSNHRTSEFLDRNIFIRPDEYEDELIASLSLNIQNMQIVPSTDVLTSITNTFILTRRYGNIKSIISNGMYQYFPSQMRGNVVLISLNGNEYSFDQETDIERSQWQYIWTCSRLDNNSVCPIDIHDHNEAILEFTSTILEPDIVYLFSLQIMDDVNQRSDETFTMVVVSPSAVDMIVSVNIEWDTTLYYVPSYHGFTTISVSIEDGSNDDILWLYTLCFEASLEDGISCASLESMNRSLIYDIEPFNTLPNHQYIVDIHVRSAATESEYAYHGMVSTIFETAAVSHINSFSISCDYHSYNEDGSWLSSDLYKTLYRDSDSFIQFIDFYLLSMSTNCIHPPCTYSYFYQITNPNKDANGDIPFYFAIGNGLSWSALSGVIFAWNYDDLNILGCVEDIYGSMTCRLVQYTAAVSLQEHTISNEICDYYTNITNHLLLLHKMEDKASLTQFMIAVVFEIIDAPYDDDECIESMIDLILYYIHTCIMDDIDGYFIYYPFQILQILYLTSDNDVIGPNGYKHFIFIYEIMWNNDELQTQKAQKYYLPYSDHDYIEWDISLVLETVSDYYSVISWMDGVDLKCSSSYSILQDDIYDIISYISDGTTRLLSRHPNEIIQHISDAIYLYARRFEFDLDAQKYRAFALNEMYTDDGNTSNTQSILETLSVSNSNIEPGTNIELQLLSFNPIYITHECLNEAEPQTQDSDDVYNTTTNTRLVYVSIHNVQDIESRRRRALDERMTLVFSWQISNATIKQLNVSHGFNLYCQQFDAQHKTWSNDNCESSTDRYSLWSLHYFECECFGISGDQIYGLVIHITHNELLMIKEATTTQHELIALDTREWILFLSLFVFLLCVGYIIPLCFVDKFAPITQGQIQLFWVFYLYASVVLANFLIQIYLSCIGLWNNSTVWLWQMEVLFGLQCANLGVFNVFLLIIVNDIRCNRFPMLTPLMISVCNALLTGFIMIFTCIHGVFLHAMDDYASSSWSLWMVYFGFICLTILFIVYLSYYWYKAKTFSGGTPYQYTEGKRETTAVVTMIAGVVLYCLGAANGYIVYALSNNHSIDDYMRSFECIHWISLFILALLICIVRRFERNEAKQHKDITSSITTQNEMNHSIIPNTDDSENDLDDFDDYDEDEIPAPDGFTMRVNHNNINMNHDESFEQDMHVKPSDTMVLLGSSADPTDNMKQSLIQFSSTSDFEKDEKPLAISAWAHVQAPPIQMPSSVPGYIANSNDTQSHFGTDALGNTMSYEPEIEMEFLDLPTNGTNLEDEGMVLSPKSDAHLYTKYQHINHVHHNGYTNDDDDDDDGGGDDVQYSPYSEHRKDLDHITAIGAEQHAQHYIGVTMSIASNCNDGYECYTADTHRRSTMDSNINGSHSDAAAERYHNASISSMGIFDWNTPPPLDQIREISLQNLNVNGWIDGSRNTSISRRHTLNGSGAAADGVYKRSPIAGKYMKHNDYDELKMHEESYYDDYRELQHPHITAPKLYGTGAGASINMEHDEDEDEDEEKAAVNHNYNKHSRHTTATSMTGTFIQPDYPNIMTAENDVQHFNILKTQNLMAIPFDKTTNHLDSNQREILNIFEQKTKQP